MIITGLFFASVILAFFWANLEIQIEGRDGWAKNLPTWRIRNELTDMVLSGAPLTGYHTWMVGFLLFAFHIPFFVNLPWTLSYELQILGVFLIFLIIEDYMWFVFNPAYGISKFNREHVTWHKKWIKFIPLGYVYALSMGGILLIITRFL